MGSATCRRKCSNHWRLQRPPSWHSSHERRSATSGLPWVRWSHSCLRFQSSSFGWLLRQTRSSSPHRCPIFRPIGLTNGQNGKPATLSAPDFSLRHLHCLFYRWPQRKAVSLTIKRNSRQRSRRQSHRWGNYCRTGNATTRFRHIDSYVGHRAARTEMAALADGIQAHPGSPCLSFRSAQTRRSSPRRSHEGRPSRRCRRRGKAWRSRTSHPS